MSWETVIGLEVHAQILSTSKLFSSSANSFGASPNSQVSIIDAGFPGTLPVLNGFCIEQSVKAGLALNATINEYSKFDRKHYFYPDLPLGYQITQFYFPIVEHGSLAIQDSHNEKKTITIERIHLEQDAGKIINDYSPNSIHIDLNRAGVPLLEIVSAPDLSNAEEAVRYFIKLRQILMYAGVCSGDMEKGAMRCDANVSVKKKGDDILGVRCEIKNLNSFRFISQAINYEAQRQIEILESGGQIIQSTMSFDPATGKTSVMRYKEDAVEYRYFPDPDLPPILIPAEYIKSITIPELPDAKIERYVTTLHLKPYDAEVIVAHQDSATFFEKVLDNGNDPTLSARWITIELFGRLNKNNLTLKASPILEQDFSDLLSSIESKKLSEKMAKQVLDNMFATGQSVKQSISNMSLVLIDDDDTIRSIMEKILLDNSAKVAEYKNGKTKLYGFFVGEAMKITKGMANPQKVNEILKTLLNE